MPRNPHKQPCQVPGCKAWAQHGQRLCASHLTSRAIGGDPARVLPLLRLTAGEVPGSGAHGATAIRSSATVAPDSGAPVGSDVAVIDEELRQLLAARALFMDWLRDLRADEDPARPAVTPTQFLRAWSDSATRVAQLLQARAALRGEKGGALDALLESVYDDLDALLQAAPGAPEAADGDASH